MSDRDMNARLMWDTLHSSVWLNVIRQLPLKQRFIVSLVCKSWRAHAVSLSQKDFEVTLFTSRSCRALGVWLRRHGALLSSLNISDNYYNHVNAPNATRIRLVDRLAMLQGLHCSGQPLQLQSLSLCLNELSVADAAVLGLCNCPALTYLKLDSNGANIGMTGAQALAPLAQLQHLVVPTQSLGDQGLQIICDSMPHLQHINLHNDGHVTDDGLLALRQLSGLTSLDLQGSISITNRGMAALSEGVPQLLELNISYCAGVDDWGMGQLCALTGLTKLNLAATGIHLMAPTVLELLSQLNRVAVLRVDRCELREPQLQALATALTSLNNLNLSYNCLASYSELRVLSGLAQLTHLDVSYPQSLAHPDADLAAVFELTQLHSLNASHIVPSRPEQRAAYDLARPMAAARAWRASATAATAGRQTSCGSGSAADSIPSHVSSSDVSDCLSDFWQKLCTNIREMARLTELNFQGNLSQWSPDPADSQEDPFPNPGASGAFWVGALECAVLIDALGSVTPQPVIQLLQLSVEPAGLAGASLLDAILRLHMQQQHDHAQPEHLQQLLQDVAVLLARARWNAAASGLAPQSNYAPKRLRSYMFGAIGLVYAAAGDDGSEADCQLASTLAEVTVAHTRDVSNSAPATLGCEDGQTSSSSVDRASGRWCGLTAAAVVKQVLPGLKRLKLTLQHLELMDNVGCVTWPCKLQLLIW